MNEMENLYEEYKKLRDELSEKNLDEVGVFELRNYRRRFESLHRQNLELQRSTRLSQDVDEEELRQVLNLGDRMWRELGDTLAPVVEVINIKMALGKQISSERIHIKTLKEDNLKTLKTLMNQNKRFKKKVNEMTDPELRAVFEDKLKIDEETIQKLKDLDASYEKRITELAEKLRTIALGGVLSELESTKKDSEGLDEDESKRLSEEMVSEADEKVEGVDDLTGEEDIEKNKTESEGLPGVEFEGVDPVTPISETEDLTHGLGDDDTEEKVPTLGGDEDAEEPVPTLGGDDDTEEPVPTFPGGDDDTEERVPTLGGDDDTEEPIPTLDGDDTTTDGESEDEEEEETPVRATVKQPKSKLWQKVQKVLEAAKVFLLTAIALHTGLIIGGINNQKVEANTNTDIVEETQSDDVLENDNQTETNNQTESNNQTETDDRVDTPVSNPTVEPTVPDESVEDAPTVIPTVPSETVETPTVEPTVNVSENDVILNAGESVYDANTGVEVGYTGAAVQETDNGYVQQENRDLEQLSNDAVVVTQDDLQPDAVETELSRTGQEVSEEEARQNMTQGEQDNLDIAADVDIDWENFFNDGPTL